MSRTILSMLVETIAGRSARRRPAHSQRRLGVESLEERRVLAADAFEVDDTPAQAKVISTDGTPQGHSLHNASDVDWVRFTLSSESDVLIQLGLPASVALESKLFAISNTSTALASGDPFSGVIRQYAMQPGTYLVQVSGYGFEVDSYTISARATAPVPPLSRTDFVKLAGEGFNALQFTPDGRLAQLLWYGDSLVYRVRDHAGQFTEETITTESSFGGFQPRDDRQAQLLFAADATPHILLTGNDTIDHYRRNDSGAWSMIESVPLGLTGFEFISHLAAAIGPKDSLHFVATVGDFQVGRLIYGTNKSGSWQVQQAASPAATETSAYFAANHPRYVSLAVDANNFAHVAFTPEFIDNGQGGFARPFSQLAYATNSTGQWTTQIVHQPPDDSGDSGSGASIAIGPDGQPAIAQFFVDRVSTGSASLARLQYLKRQANGSWTTETVTSTPDGYVAGDGARFTGFSPQLIFDAEGLPHIAFSDYASQHFPQFGADEFAGQIRHAVKENGSWRIDRVLTQADPLHNQMIYPTMAVWSNSIAFAGIRRFDYLRTDDTIIRSEHFYASANLNRTGLTVSAANLNIAESGQTVLTVTRHNGSSQGSLTVTLTNGDATELSFNTTVTIPVGAPSVTIPVTALNDNLEDGKQTVTITASAAGYLSGRTIVNVTDLPHVAIRGVKFEDRNADGIRSDNEPGLANWTIFLDANQNGALDTGEQRTVTNTDGEYSFTGLNAGTYRVVEVSMAGWGRTTPLGGFHRITLAGGNEAEGIDFGGLRSGFDSETRVLSVIANGDDDLELLASGGQLVVRRNGAPDASFAGIASAQIESVVVLGGNGDNSIDLQGLAAADFPNLESVIVREPSGGVDALDGSPIGDHFFTADADSLRGRAGNDVFAVRDLSFASIDGGPGTDTLLLDGSGMHLNLPALAANRITSIEIIDIIGHSPNELTLSPLAVLNLSDETDTLIVRADGDDRVNLGPGWKFEGPQFVDGRYFNRITQAGATVMLSGPHAWQNPVDRLDVNRDGVISPIDALLTINALNAGQTGQLPDPNISAQLPMWAIDVSGDDILSPVDAALVINFLNGRTSGEGEGSSQHNEPIDELAFAWALDQWLREANRRAGR